jgi:hypothetical protein
MSSTASALITMSLLLFTISCGQQGNDAGPPTTVSGETDSTAGTGGTTSGNGAPSVGGGHDHAHNEVDLDAVTIAEWTVALAQGHGSVAAGVQGHLVVKLPYNDNGATVVRAWIGGKDRLLSMVGRGVYAPSHDDYDIHVMAPDTLPANTMWWIEIQTPDGAKVVGSAQPILE